MKNPVNLMSQLFAQLALVLCALAWPSVWAQTTQPGGQWQNGPNLPYFPVHIHLLPNSTVMVWPGDGVSGDDPRVWNPATGSVSALSRIGFDPFCSAHTYLPDGRLFVAGGHIDNWVGLPDASIYNPVNNTWTRQARMNLGRWYPTATGLPNGDVLVVSGTVDTPDGTNPLPQVWQSSTGTWRDLTGAQLSLPIYPYMFLAPNGSVFNAGPEVTTRYLNTAEVIDLNAGSPAWRSVGSMATARRSMNATMLPDGKILATGGTRGPGFNNADPGMPVLAAEMWDPATETWQTMAAGSIPRIYHSTAVLLPDARVLVAGGNGQTQTEIFSPPYLFAGARPSISSAPASVGKGQSFFMGTPDAAGINGVTWIALPSVTHTNNMHQGVFRSTSITQAGGGINVVAPNDSTVPAGHYMVFLMRNGVPSTAKIIQLGAQSNNPSPSVASMAPTGATAGGPAFSLTVTGSNFVGASRVRWNAQDRTNTFVSATQLTAAITAADIGAAGSAQVSVSSPGPGGGTSLSLSFLINASPPPANNPVPSLASISPAGAAQGAAGFTLTATGSNFAANSVVRWNGANRPTTFVSATQLRAAISATDLQAAGTAAITVIAPTPGGGTSAAQTFTVSGPAASNPVPVQASLSPANATTGGAGFTLSVNGSSFIGGSRVRWNGVDRTTTVVSATQLTAAIPASDIAASGTAQITVFNPIPGGGTSSAQPFVVSSAPNLALQGTIIAKITAPLGSGSDNLETIRDGVRPAVGSSVSGTQYDTYDGPNAAADDWIGYQFSSARTFNRVVFQEGMNFFDGGWFNNFTVQIRQGGNWVNVSNLTSTPLYPGINNNTNFETYTLQFTPISGDAIRIFGSPGGSAAFISVAELRVFGQ